LLRRAAMVSQVGLEQAETEPVRRLAVVQERAEALLLQVPGS
jgi:hypothetical protein